VLKPVSLSSSKGVLGSTPVLGTLSSLPTPVASNDWKSKPLGIGKASQLRSVVQSAPSPTDAVRVHACIRVCVAAFVWMYVFCIYTRIRVRLCLSVLVNLRTCILVNVFVCMCDMICVMCILLCMYLYEYVCVRECMCTYV
jgi:hypothetical protein